jgi:hypothetical protein
VTFPAATGSGCPAQGKRAFYKLSLARSVRADTQTPGEDGGILLELRSVQPSGASDWQLKSRFGLAPG